MARPLWKGCLRIGRRDLAVKLYAAVEESAIRFRLLHRSDREPVHQQIVRKSDGRVVSKTQRRKAYPVGDRRAVLIDADELKKLGPERSRRISLCRFVPVTVLSDAWYDRPYHLTPEGGAQDYASLASVLAKKDRVGIVRWAMRGKRYVGALIEDEGRLQVITLRRAEQLISVDTLEIDRQPIDDAELKLARQLVDLVSADFEPALWQDDYRKRVQELVAAKQRGSPSKRPISRSKRSAVGLADQLSRSLASLAERKVA